MKNEETEVKTFEEYRELSIQEVGQFKVVPITELAESTAKGARILATWIEKQFSYRGDCRVFLVALSELQSLADARAEVDKAKEKLAKEESERQKLSKENNDLLNLVRSGRVKCETCGANSCGGDE